MRIYGIIQLVAAAALGWAAVAAAEGTASGEKGEAARSVGVGGICWQLGASALLEVGVGLAGYGLMHEALSFSDGSDNTHGGNAPAFFIGLSLFAAYPLAATVGTYLAGKRSAAPRRTRALPSAALRSRPTPRRSCS
jgi:hypothetical protein